MEAGLRTVVQLGTIDPEQAAREELHSVAAAVLQPDGRPLAALHLHGPAYCFPDPDSAHDHGMAVAQAAKSLAAQLNA